MTDRLRRFLLFTFIGSTTAPGVLATLHLSVLITVFSLALASVIALLTYFSVRVDWREQGLYVYTRRAGFALSTMFLVTWLVSYYLYVIYTAIYIPYYVLNLDGAPAIALTVVIPVSVFLLVTFTNPLYAFPVIYLAQLIFSLPMGWRFGLGAAPSSLASLFINILSSSLLLVCITLSAFVRGDRIRDSPFILYTFLISSVVLLYGAFLVPSSITVVASAFGNYGLILAELTAINNLLRPMISRRSLLILNSAIIPLTLIGNINYSLFYNSLIVPSVSFLYISLFIFAISTILILGGVKRALSIVSAFLFAFGEYNVIKASSGYLLYEAVISFIAGIAMALILYALSSRSGRAFGQRYGVSTTG